MSKDKELKEEEVSFEHAMQQLEEIVGKLEEGDVPLEKAIDYFQKGMVLSKLCHDKLQHVEKQMDFILREDGELKPFELQEEEKS
ncbi:exodeoxyribonuclease VII small subunit [Metabacillus litoralis]|uniref:Exodeoxyribonuclease 7 small subunit n=1 Tax=Metabacillus litoralis TaxID=152268 RepID=A0A5C6W8V8_9BACI|nr:MULTISPECIES: exodeoxyribonuclease VII small subunit [Metabacillus]MBM7604587.1 exodeoxyribonuclease VII small subunit [Metabacillus crassostreae]TXC92304.1 exodeoxyribonuclease VII small subunit [Metabacillus litoralis]